MCTVSFYRNKDRLVITSNRDEHISRPIALPPAQYVFNGVKLYFPKDPLAGGSWFTINESGDVLVLLNGADTKHIPDHPYRKSRGLILLELASMSNVLEGWQIINLERIEPFSIVVYSQEKLYYMQWNGLKREGGELDSDRPHIWSSATLYSKEVRIQREIWYNTFLAERKYILNEEDLFQFHTQAPSQEVENAFVMNRNNTLLTKSVTQYVCLKESKKLFVHFDLILHQRTKLEIGL